MKNKFLLIDDDPIFLEIMKRWATLEGVELNAYRSLDEFLDTNGSVGTLAKFDAAVVDCNLEEDVHGIIVAAYIDALKLQTPVILISGTPVEPTASKQWPPCVVKFINKSAGHQAIIWELKKRAWEHRII